MPFNPNGPEYTIIPNYGVDPPLNMPDFRIPEEAKAVEEEKARIANEKAKLASLQHKGSSGTTIIGDEVVPTGSIQDIANIGSSMLSTARTGMPIGNAQNLYAYTKDTTNLIATSRTGEGNLFIKANGESLVTLRQFSFSPVRWNGVITHLGPDIPYSYTNQTISIETQNLLKQSGIGSIFGTPIPENVTKPLVIGQRVAPNAKEAPAVFRELYGRSADDDQRYRVRNRVPDSVSYHYTKQMSDSTMDELKKEHAQYVKPMSELSPSFESDLAKARYLTGMYPNLTTPDAKKFDHYTYWKYKGPNPSNPFRGAFVHIFFSRPDIHIFDRTKGNIIIRNDIASNPELATLVYMNPEGALSLVGKWQTKAVTDLNLFLSNRAIGIDISNESLESHEFAEGFNRIKSPFGGRMDNMAGDISITFAETDDLSVSNTILLWMKYIHATYTGRISPLIDSSNAPNNRNFGYNVGYLHPMWRRSDSQASIYVIATDMTQRNIIFWRKYFGVYPTSTGHSGLSANGDGKIAEAIRRMSITFKYVTFRTNNMVDLFAFNRLSNLQELLDNNAHYHMRDNRYQVKDLNVIPDHELISGLPFIGIDQHVNSSVSQYNTSLPEKMYTPELLFARSDGAFIPRTASGFNDWVVRHWGTGYNTTSATVTDNGPAGQLDNVLRERHDAY